MRLEGIHHVTAITGDVLRNVEFYTRVLGLRLVGKSVNQDDPTVYHVFYSDEHGRPGADLTFFEYPHAVRGRAGAGMVHRVVWRVTGVDAIGFWEQRLAAAGFPATRSGDSLLFADPEGLEHELVVTDVADEPRIADHPEIPRALALQGFHGVRAYAADAGPSLTLLEDGLAFEPVADREWEVRGESRGSFYAYDAPPEERGIAGAGTVHHVAWASLMDEHELWRQRAQQAGASPTPVIDRFYFRSIYFREPSGVLFEIATIGPGFTTDEPLETLGEALSLPPAFEHVRSQVERVLTPITNPRTETARR